MRQPTPNSAPRKLSSFVKVTLTAKKGKLISPEIFSSGLETLFVRRLLTAVSVENAPVTTTGFQNKLHNSNQFYNKF